MQRLKNNQLCKIITQFNIKTSQPHLNHLAPVNITLNQRKWILNISIWKQSRSYRYLQKIIPVLHWLTV